MSVPHSPASPSGSADLTAFEPSVRSWVRERLSPLRFTHTEGVVETVTRLAAYHRIAEVPALRLAGWIHDAAREYRADDLLVEARRLSLPVRPVEAQSPRLLHGAVALGLAREVFGLDHPVVTSAVLYHTTGHPDMSRADKVFYLADLVEPSRTFAWIDQARALAEADLDTALLFSITRQLRRLLKKPAVIDTRAVELRNRLLAEGTPLTPRDVS